MRGKAALVVGLTTGYVLGTRDGRARYEQLRSQATRLWQDPRVQQKVARAKDSAPSGPDASTNVVAPAAPSEPVVTDTTVTADPLTDGHV